MKILSRIPLLEEILAKYQQTIGDDFIPYRNHVCRVVNFCFQLKKDMDDEQKEKVIIAGVFHDLGIWTEDTLDYLPPSVSMANAYLQRRNLLNWTVEIELMINLHHKLSKYADDANPLVEVFRRADLVDLSLGMVKFGLSPDIIANIKAMFPNAGFHKRLTQLAAREFYRHPFRPLPFLKW